MHCRNCEYPLWNLTTSQCPECGEAFRVEDFEFKPNSVRYRCPDCDQEYYGTSRSGHLVPPEFDCRKCGSHIHMNQMRLEPAEGLREEQTRASNLAWSGEGGFMRRWIATIGQSLVAPHQIGRSIASEGNVGGSLLFAALTSLATGLLTAVPFLFLFGWVGSMTAAQGGGAGTGVGLAMAVSLFGTAFGSVIVIIVAGAMYGCITHGILAMTGGASGGLGKTLSAVYFASGANVVAAIPCLGAYVSWIWWLVSAVLAVKETHSLTGARASLAVLPAPIITVVAIVGIYFFMIFAMVTQMNPGAMASVTTTAQGAELSIVSDMVFNEVMSNNGAFPGHVLELAVDGDLGAGLFVSATTDTDVATAPVGDETLASFIQMGPNLRRDFVADLAASLPEDTVAYRVGDFVFTYGGVDFWSDGEAWTVILAPELAPGEAPGPQSFVAAADADGAVHEFSAVAFQDALARQNAYRRLEGLPILPNPAEVRAGAPVTRTGTP